MERRYFLARLGAVPLAAQLVIDGKAASVNAKLESGHYLLFVDPQAVNIEDVAGAASPMLPPDCFIEIISVKLKPGQTMDDAVRLYQVVDHAKP